MNLAINKYSGIGNANNTKWNLFCQKKAVQNWIPFISNQRFAHFHDRNLLRNCVIYGFFPVEMFRKLCILLWGHRRNKYSHSRWWLIRVNQRRSSGQFRFCFHFWKISYLFMPGLSIAQLVGIYTSLLCFVYTLIEMSLERHLEEAHWRSLNVTWDHICLRSDHLKLVMVKAVAGCVWL